MSDGDSSAKLIGINVNFDGQPVMGEDGELYWEFRLLGHDDAFAVAKTPDAFVAWVGAIIEQATGREVVEKTTTMRLAHDHDD